MGTTTADEREVVERFAELDRLLGVAASAVRPDGLSAHAAEQIQNQLISITKRASGLQTLLADRAAEASGWRARQARSAADDLARRAGTSTTKAKDTLDTSKKAKRHPSIEAALHNGRLSAEQASEIAGAAEANPAAAPGLVADAQNMSLPELRDKCARVRAAADRDPEATAARLHRDRFLRYGRRADGSFSGSFRLAPEAGAELPYARGGPTRYANLGLLCWHHHQEKTAEDRARDGPRTG